MDAPAPLRPSPRDTWTNLRRAGLLRGATGLLPNTLRKARRRSTCCGRFGDPGC